MTDLRREIIHGDALEALRALPGGSVDMVLTDPPYSSGGMTRGDRMGGGSKYLRGAVDARAEDFAGDNRDQRGFLIWCGLWLTEVHRVLKPGGICAAFTDWRQLPTLTDAFQVGGLVWRGVSVWDKPNARPQLGRPVAAAEYLVWGTRGARPLEGEVGPRTYHGDAPRDRMHQTEKPIDLLRAWVQLAPPGGLVLDPFAGSGSTGEAAVLENRGFLGIEITAHYAAAARERIESIDPIGAVASATQPTLFGDIA